MTTSEDESTTYHRDLLHIFRHGRDTFPKSWGKAVDVVGIPGNSQGNREGGRWKVGWGGYGISRVSARTVYLATSVAAGV